MRLPEHIYQALKPQMAHHSGWHLARHREAEIPPEILAEWQAARQAFPNVRYLDQPGCGEEFLRFHRVMIRHFLWILGHTQGPAYAYQPWATLPAWLTPQFQASYLTSVQQHIDSLVPGGTADQLGNLIEATLVGAGPGRNIHNRSHGAINTIEAPNFPGDDTQNDAGMGDPATAPHNEHFWGLHGWIDAFFASWQTGHGEVVDQSPLDPAGHHHHMALHGMAADAHPPVLTKHARTFLGSFLKNAE